MDRGFWTTRTRIVNGREIEMDFWVFFPSMPEPERPKEIEIREIILPLRPAVIPKIDLSDTNKIYTFTVKPEKSEEKQEK